MSIMNKGWWKLTINTIDGDIDPDDDITLNQIADQIINGFREGEVLQKKQYNKYSYKND